MDGGHPLRHHEHRRGRPASIEFEEKPQEPKSNHGLHGHLHLHLEEAARVPDAGRRRPAQSSNDFGKNIIPAMLDDGRADVRLSLSRATGRTWAPSTACGRPTWTCSTLPMPTRPVRRQVAHLCAATPAWLPISSPTAPVCSNSHDHRGLRGLRRCGLTACSSAGVTVREGAAVSADSVVMPGAVIEARRAGAAGPSSSEDAVIGAGATVGDGHGQHRRGQDSGCASGRRRARSRPGSSVPVPETLSIRMTSMK